MLIRKLDRSIAASADPEKWVGRSVLRVGLKHCQMKNENVGIGELQMIDSVRYCLQKFLMYE